MSGVVDSGDGDGTDLLEGIGKDAQVRQRLVEGTLQQGLFVFKKNVGRCFNQLPDRHGSQHSQPLVQVATCFQLLPVKFFSEDAGQLIHGVIKRNQAEAAAIFKVDDAVTDVIGGFYQKGEWMSAPASRREGMQPQFRSHLRERCLFRLEEAELLLAFPVGITLRQRCGTWIFCKCAQAGRCQAQTVLVFVENAESLGVSLKTGEVVPLLVAHMLPEALSGGMMAEEIGDRVFAGMPERGIAEIVRQRCRRYDRTEVE